MESAPQFTIRITFMDDTNGKAGPFTHRMLAEQALATLVGRPDVASAELDTETTVIRAAA